MKYNFFLIYIILINLPLFFFSLNNPANLNSDYPFSVKKDTNTAVIFSYDCISIFDVTKTTIPADPLEKYQITCPSGKEKGGIYHLDYYYTSCLNPSDNTQFQINVYDSSFNLYESTAFYSFTSPIRFFIKDSSPAIVEASWTNNGKFNSVKFHDGNPIQHTDYPVDKMARDIDCIYNQEFNKIICAYGIKKDNEIYSCAVNIFTDSASFISNFKMFSLCNNHQSRKIKLDNDDKNIFYYYYVDTNFDAYILPLKMTSSVSIETKEPIKIMNGCDESQNSFELAEEKFNGYFVFSCVESRFKTKIKIQLFKIEDDQIIFYEDHNVDNTFEFEDANSNSEFSMINFIVLKPDLNFGLISYRTNTLNGQYTIFNQPGCIDYELNMNPLDLYQNKEITLDFQGVIKNDNYAGGEIQICEEGEGLKASPLPPLKTDVKITSKNYIIGELSFTFLVKNIFYKSEICTAHIEVKDCFIHCHTCSIKSTDFYEQECELGCKPGSYPIINFPLDYYDNCCEKDVDCPNYLYLNINQYEICYLSCLACSSGTENDCITCYNEKELENYDIIEQGYIRQIKLETTSLYFYWENEEHKKCVNRDTELYIYLDENTLTYRDCFYSCETCFGQGNSTINNCKRCRESSFYFHFEVIDSLNCLNRTEAPSNYYLFKDNYSPTETTQSRYWTICDEVCSTCSGMGRDECTSCEKNYYPKCSEKNLNNFECFNSIPGKNYFFDETNNCYEMCDSTCATCDKSRIDEIANCLSCKPGFILFNRNCYIHCPLPYYELDHKKCVDKCPEYTRFELTRISENEYYNQCYNCREINKCIYLGKQIIPQYLVNECIECTAITQTFVSNIDYNILDDCYELCLHCTQRGTVIQMNCLSCYDSAHCLVEDYNNCVVKGTDVDNYYMVTNPDNSCTYKKCYISCKSCTTWGDSQNNNCIFCADGYQPDPYITGNCVKICQYYWYMDPATNKFKCTEGASCPYQLKYLVELNKQCVSDCIYAFNFNSISLYKYKKTCVTQCPDNSMKDNLYYICHSLDDSRDVFNNIQNYISYQSTSPKNLLIYSNDKTKYFHLFNTSRESLTIYQQAANNVGTSLVDFSYCIATLRRELDYDRNEIFYIGVMDIIREDTSAPQFEYTIHDHTGIKLDINLCQDDIIVINKSFSLVEDMQLVRYIQYYYNYDIVDYNENNKFFCDVCSKFEYDKEDPYDVILNDRYNSFYQNKDYYFCEKICDPQYTKLYLDDSRVECVCKGKQSFTGLKKEEFYQFNKIEQICHDWFLQYLKCGNNFFNKNFFSENYANVIMFIFIIVEILCIFLFFFVTKKNLRNILKFVLDKKNKLRKKYLKENPIQENNRYNTDEYYPSTNREYNETTSKFKNTLTNSNNTNTEHQENSQQSQRSQNYTNKTHSSYRKSGTGSYGNNNTNNNSKSENANKRQSKEIADSKNETEEIEENSDENNEEENEENSNANPPKKQKRKSNKSSEDYDNNIINIEDVDEDEDEIKNKKNKKKKKEEKKNDKIENKKAPKTAFQKYSKRFLMNRKDYVDNSYHEDSYDFNLEKNWKKKGSQDDDYFDDEESEEESDEYDESEDDEESQSKNGTNDINTNKSSNKNNSKKSGINSENNSNNQKTNSKKSNHSENKLSHTQNINSKSNKTASNKNSNNTQKSNNLMSETETILISYFID